jgi:hypothetical protein
VLYSFRCVLKLVLGRGRSRQCSVLHPFWCNLTSMYWPGAKAGAGHMVSISCCILQSMARLRQGHRGADIGYHAHARRTGVAVGSS